MSPAPDDLATLRNGIATMIPWERHNNALLPTSATIFGSVRCADAFYEIARGRTQALAPPHTRPVKPIEFVAQPLFSRGTSTPCIARTLPQTQELIGAFPIDASRRVEIVEVSANVMSRLAACEDVAERVISQVAAGMESIEREGLLVQAGGRATTLPSVLNLASEAEQFLYSAKLALRDIGGLFAAFYDQPFGHRYHKAQQWATDTFGADDGLSRLLAEDSAWINQLLDMRNEVEHPKPPHGPLIIKNFELVGQRDTLQVLQPVWHLRTAPAAYIATDMRVLADNLLTFFEDLLTDGLIRSAPGAPFSIREIPLADRNPEFPIRLRVELTSPPIGS